MQIRVNDDRERENEIKKLREIIEEINTKNRRELDKIKNKIESTPKILKEEVEMLRDKIRDKER